METQLKKDRTPVTLFRYFGAKVYSYNSLHSIMEKLRSSIDVNLKIKRNKPDSPDARFRLKKYHDVQLCLPFSYSKVESEAGLSRASLTLLSRPAWSSGKTGSKWLEARGNAGAAGKLAGLPVYRLRGSNQRSTADVFQLGGLRQLRVCGCCFETRHYPGLQSILLNSPSVPPPSHHKVWQAC